MGRTSRSGRSGAKRATRGVAPAEVSPAEDQERAHVIDGEAQPLEGPATPEDDGSLTEVSSDEDRDGAEETESSSSGSSAASPPAQRSKRRKTLYAGETRPSASAVTRRHGAVVDYVHVGRAPTRSIQPPPPRRLKLPTVGASTLRRLANRAKVVAVEDVLAPKEFSGIGTAAGPSTPQLAPAEYLRGVGVIAAYRAYFFPELAVQWAMYMVWLQGRAAGLPTAAIKQLDGHGRTLLAQYPGEYHTPADLTESVQALMPAPPSRPVYAARSTTYRPAGGSRPFQPREPKACCFRWNEGRCHNGASCRFGHKCRECGANDHPATACPMTRRFSGNGPRPLMGHPSPAAGRH
ncbi:uncharacterized protein LOC122375265 isoform X2 [Amphibalanus amphitrite]|uniref:uncharacterized protein LOC122375265 isoform X2 n=1 Tax=Amphibalanus amphitrite TaxID=1232801 RepID=UPI001C92886F|nr:uncharacterized protein LOC122375265 isoform X2 [Amphibalanus amphitrite]